MRPLWFGTLLCLPDLCYGRYLKNNPNPPAGATMMKTRAERIAAAEKQVAAKKARLARLKAQESTEARKLDTRRKIVVGGAVLAHAEIDPAFAIELRHVLAKAVARDQDKAVIADLLPVNGVGTEPAVPVSENPLAATEHALP